MLTNIVYSLLKLKKCNCDIVNTVLYCTGAVNFYLTPGLYKYFNKNYIVHTAGDREGLCFVHVMIEVHVIMVTKY